MLLSTLFSLSADLSLVDVRLEHEVLTLVLRSSQTKAACPACAQPSTHVHGHYTRQLADLPCQKRPVRVCLEVRRFAHEVRNEVVGSRSRGLYTLSSGIKACRRHCYQIPQHCQGTQRPRGPPHPGVKTPECRDICDY